MKHILAVTLGLGLISGSAYAKEPVIEVSDGKVSVSAEAVPLSRLLSLWDKAMGTASQVKPELAGRTINVQFENLPFDEAVHKMFQGQSLNYAVIQGKGIRVYELVQGGPVTTSVTSSPASFSDPQPSPNNLFQPVTPPPPVQQPVQQPVNPAVGQGQTPNSPQAPVNTLFGARPDPNANANQQAPGVPAPGTPPPPIGAANPFAAPPVGGLPAGPVPSPVPQQPVGPAGPGNVGATPGQVK